MWIKAIDTTDSGCIVEGASFKDGNRQNVKYTTTKQALNRFVNETGGWFTVVLPADTRTKLDFVKAGVTRLQIKTTKVKRMHMITKVEIIHDATDLDKDMYRWFNSKCKNDDDIPKLLIVYLTNHQLMKIKRMNIYNQLVTYYWT